MKKQLVVSCLLIVLVVLISQIAPIDAAPVADCSSFASGSITALTSLNVSFTCSADNLVYFGVCDSGGVPNDDLFNVTYNSVEVSSNEYVGGREIVHIGSTQAGDGAHTAVLNSLNSTPYPPATYSYAISANQNEVSDYLAAWCGLDYGVVGADCLQSVPVFTMDKAPSNGTLEFRIMLGNEDSREVSGLLKTWNIIAGQQLNNEMVYNVPAPRWTRLYWQPDGDSDWYMLTSQYWHDDGTKASEYGVSCLPAAQPSYHTSFDSAVPLTEVCFDLLHGCD